MNAAPPLHGPRATSLLERVRSAEQRREAAPGNVGDLDSQLQRLDGQLRDVVSSRDQYWSRSRKVSEGLLKGGLGVMAGGLLLNQFASAGMAAAIMIGVGIASAVASAPVNMVLSAVLARKDRQASEVATQRLDVARQRMECAKAESELRQAREDYDRIVGETRRLQEALSARGGAVEDLGATIQIGGIRLDKRQD